MSPLEIFLLILALLLSAYFSGMEIAFVSSSKLRYEVDKADRSLSSRLLGIFYSHPDNYISTILVGNNIVLVVYSILMSRLLDSWLIALIPNISDSVLLIIDTILSTTIVIIFGEFLPKTLFRHNANASLRAFSLPTWFFYILLWPFAQFATLCSKGLLRLMGVRIGKKTAVKAFSKNDLDDLIEASIGSGDDPMPPEVQIFQNALDFSTTRVRDCMIPRNEVAAVDKDCTTEELLHRFIETGYSKIVVYSDTIDNVIGYIHSSELFQEASGATPKRLESLIEDETPKKELKECSRCTSDNYSSSIIQHPLKEMPIVPETASAQELMKTLMQQKRSMAVVVDEFGGTAGIITLEDIMEELTGDIEDEHDTRHLVAKAISDGSYILSARMEIEKVNELFGLELPLSEEYHTIGGLILQYHHSLPAINQTITLPEGFIFKIIKTDKNKINLVRLTLT